jgi:hypothetical protein
VLDTKIRINEKFLEGISEEVPESVKMVRKNFMKNDILLFANLTTRVY